MRGFDLALVRGNEQRHADASARQRLYGITDHGLLTGHIQPAFGRALGAAFRHEAGRMRLRAHGNGDHVRGRSHFEIQRLVDLGLQSRNVFIPDMPAVFAQMRSDAIGSGRHSKLCRADRIRMPSATSVADGCDVIDIHAQAKVRCLRHGPFSSSIHACGARHDRLGTQLCDDRRQMLEVIHFEINRQCREVR